MMTFAKARRLLSPGDVVYTSNGKAVIPARISGIYNEYLDTDADVLYYEDHGSLWWLTEKVAKENFE